MLVWDNQIFWWSQAAQPPVTTKKSGLSQTPKESSKTDEIRSFRPDKPSQAIHHGYDGYGHA